jgi:hypothetical protein
VPSCAGTLLAELVESVLDPGGAMHQGSRRRVRERALLP